MTGLVAAAKVPPSSDVSKVAGVGEAVKVKNAVVELLTACGLEVMNVPGGVVSISTFVEEADAVGAQAGPHLEPEHLLGALDGAPSDVGPAVVSVVVEEVARLLREGRAKDGAHRARPAVNLENPTARKSPAR